MFICIFFNKMYKQIIPVSLLLLLCAFPSCNLSSIQSMPKHGLRPKDRDTIFYLRGPWENRATSEAS